MLPKQKNKQNHHPSVEQHKLKNSQSKHKPSTQLSNVGKIVKNRAKSIFGPKSTNCSNYNSRANYQVLFSCNYTRPSSKNKERQTFLEKFDQMKCKYEMIDEYLNEKINRLESSKNSRILKSSKFENQENRNERVKSKADNYQKKHDQCKKLGKLPEYCQNKNDYSQITNQIKNQIQLEGKLRALKHKINQKNTQVVRSILSQKYKMQQQSYTLTIDQFDPFMVQMAESNPQQLAKQISLSFEECQNNWIRKLSRTFKKQDVEALFKRLDFDQQDQISLKVFVRQMSLLLNLNLRKRDLYTIFVRLSGEALITKSSFLKTLSKY